MPDETGGPYPGDGANGPNVLDDSGVVRSDITSSFGSSTTRAEGVPLTINLTVTDAGNGYSAMAGVAVYLWHCDQIALPAQPAGRSTRPAATSRASAT